MRTHLTVLIALCFVGFLSAAQTLNPNFGKSGTSLININEHTNKNYNALSISLSKDNHLFLGGDVDFESLIHKIKPDGNDDLSFSKRGFYFFDYGRSLNNRVNETLKYPGNKQIGIGQLIPNLSLSRIYDVSSVAIVVRLLENGEPDTSFGIGGKAAYFHNRMSLAAHTGVIQPDGKIIVACFGDVTQASVGLKERLVLVRFTAQGLVDSSFGTNGGFVIPPFRKGDRGHYGDLGLALQPDGKIVLGGVITENIFISNYSSTRVSPAVYRVTPDGKIDSSFGLNGVYSNRFGYEDLAINSVLIQPDGKIVVAGNTLTDSQVGASQSQFLMFRLTSQGILDNSFSNNGIFLYTNSSWKEKTIGHIEMQDDKIIVAACHNTNTEGVLDIFRLKLNGDFDSSFAQSAVIYQRPMAPGYFLTYAKLTLDSSMGIAALGYSTNTPNHTNNYNIGHVVVRLSKEGVPHTGFNSSGSREYNVGVNSYTNNFNYGSSDRAQGFTRLSNGKLIVAGDVEAHYLQKQDIGITRLTSLGKIDSSFGQNGRKIFTGPTFFTRLRAFLKLDDDKMLIARDENSLIKIDSTGALDAGFGTNGELILTLPRVNGTSTRIQSIAQQTDKKIILLTDKHLLRLNVNGTIDNSFGTNGMLTLNPSATSRTVKIQADGKIVVASQDIFPSLFRCSANGVPENSFGGSNTGYGFVTVSLPPGHGSFENIFVDFEFQPDGKIIVLCMKDNTNRTVLPGSNNFRDIILFRVNSDGTMDMSFGNYALPDYFGTSHLILPFTEEIPGDLLLTNDGKLLIAGYFNRGTGWDIGLIQLNANGTYDTTCTIQGFNTAGLDNVIDERFGSNPFLKILPDENGNYLVAGSQMGQGADFLVATFIAPDAPMANYTTFNANKDSCLSVNLSWETNTECGLDSFYVEHSTDNIVFNKIGSIRAAGNPMPSNTYNFKHNNAVYNNNYYRLRSIASGTAYGVSQVKTVNIPAIAIASIKWENMIKAERDSLFDAELHWSTQFENGSKHFEVQISTDSTVFQTIAVVNASGNSTTSRQYSTTINSLSAGKYFFRLRLLGNNCREMFSEIKSITLEKGCNDKFMVAPNPVRTMLHIVIPSCEKGDLFVFNSLGQLVHNIRNISQQSFVDINCSRWAAGNYYVQFRSNKTYTAKILKVTQ